MEFSKRQNDITIECVSNGYVLVLGGTSKDSGDWITRRTFYSDLKQILPVLEQYFKLKD